MLMHLEPSGLIVYTIYSVVFRSIVKDLEELKMSRFGVMTHLKKPHYAKCENNYIAGSCGKVGTNGCLSPKEPTPTTC